MGEQFRAETRNRKCWPECLFCRVSALQSYWKPDTWCLVPSFACMRPLNIVLHSGTLSGVLITEVRAYVTAQRRVTARRILSVCSSLKFRFLIYFSTLEEWKLAFASLCKDIKVKATERAGREETVARFHFPKARSP